VNENTGSRYKTYISSLASDFRANTMGRYDAVEQELRLFMAGGDSVSDNFNNIRNEIHSIKGTAGTFGFLGLSVIAHALDQWMHGIAVGEADGLTLNSPGLGVDLGTFLGLMREYTENEPIMTEADARQTLQQTSFLRYTGEIVDIQPEQPPLVVVCSAQGPDESLETLLENIGCECIFVGLNTGAVTVLETCEPDIVLVKCSDTSEQTDALSFAGQVLNDDRVIAILAASDGVASCVSAAIPGDAIKVLIADSASLIHDLAALKTATT